MNTTDTYVKSHICLAGDGRLATQLKTLLDAYSLPFTQVSRKTSSNYEIVHAVRTSTHVWMAISDSAIEGFFNDFLDYSDLSKKWIHFSGSHNSQHVFSAHPLMTFSHTPISADDWRQVHFVVSPPASKSEMTSLTLNDLIPSVKNSWTYLPPDKKAFYHALCVMAGNFPMILWSEVLTQFQNLSLPPAALNTYLDRVVSNFKTEGPSALTGPIVRNDVKTIKENLNSLEKSSLKPLYEAFVKHKGIKL